jgi:hypothetical protein
MLTTAASAHGEPELPPRPGATAGSAHEYGPQAPHDLLAHHDEQHHQGKYGQQDGRHYGRHVDGVLALQLGQAGTRVVESGEIRVAVGGASDQLPLQGSFTLCGPERAVGPGRVLDTPAEVVPR